MGADYLGNDFKIRTCFVGDSGVGKSVLFAYLTTRQPPKRSEPTLATDYRDFIVPLSNGRSNNKYLTWDCPGSALNENRVLGCCVRMSVVFVCFDPEVRETWLHVPKWIQEVYDRSPDAVFALCKLCKAGRGKSSDVVVTDAEIQSYADAHEFLWHEVHLDDKDACLQFMGEVLKVQHHSKNVSPGTELEWQSYVERGSLANDNPMQQREAMLRAAEKAEKVKGFGCRCGGGRK